MMLEQNGLVYDSDNDKYACILSATQGETFAFVQVVDQSTSKPIIKRYWGLYDHEAPEESTLEIMNKGGKWPDLPKVGDVTYSGPVAFNVGGKKR